jgi:hypothetical protein
MFISKAFSLDAGSSGVLLKLLTLWFFYQLDSIIMLDSGTWSFWIIRKKRGVVCAGISMSLITASMSGTRSWSLYIIWV